MILPGRLTMALAGAAIGVTAFTASHYYAYQRGYEAARLDAMRRSVEILRERSETDDEIRNMDDSALCRSLGGLPDECAGL